MNVKELEECTREELDRIHNILCHMHEHCEGCPCGGMDCCNNDIPKVTKEDLIAGIIELQRSREESE